MKLSEINKTELEYELFTCAQCGYCQDACPIYEEIPWESASPRGKLYWIKRILTNGLFRENIEGDNNFVERIYQCTLCGRCHEVCQTTLDTLGIWNAARTEIYNKEKNPKTLKMLVDNLEKTRNPYGMDEDSRLDWSEYTGYESPPMKRKAEIAYFVGCTTAFKSANHKTAHAISVILDYLDENWTLLGEIEWCCGAPLMMSGDIESTRKLMVHNIKNLKELGIKMLITGCPSCYRMWKKEIPILVDQEMPFAVKHFTEYIADKIYSGKLVIPKSNDKITYHDPCELSRLSGIIEAPRKILKAISSEYRETKENGMDVRCCGGGGLLEATNSSLRINIAKFRLNQVDESQAEILTSCCPSCNKTFLDAQRERGGIIKVFDLSVYIAEKLDLI